MENKRETKEYVTTGGNKIVYKTYLTAGEHKQIEAEFLKSAKINFVGEKVVIDNVSPLVQGEKENKMVEMLTVSINENKENILQNMLDLPYEEWNEILKIYQDIGGKKKQ